MGTFARFQPYMNALMVRVQIGHLFKMLPYGKMLLAPTHPFSYSYEILTLVFLEKGNFYSRLLISSVLNST